MKKTVVMLGTLAILACMLCGMVTIVLASSPVVSASYHTVGMTIDPINAIIATVVAAVVGIIAFAKRHYSAV